MRDDSVVQEGCAEISYNLRTASLLLPDLVLLLFSASRGLCRGSPHLVDDLTLGSGPHVLIIHHYGISRSHDEGVCWLCEAVSRVLMCHEIDPSEVI